MQQERKRRPARIELKRYSKELPPTDAQLEETAELFIEVFAGEPWHEVNKCGSCLTYSGPEVRHGENCSDCKNGVLEEAYQNDEIQGFITGVLEEESGVLHLMELDGEVIGFAWGGVKGVEEIASRFDGEARLEVVDKLRNRMDETGLDRLFKIAEIGVNRQKRGNGYGKKLFRELKADSEHANAISTVWTRKDTALTPICIKEGFEQIFGPEVVLNDKRLEETGRNIIGVNEEMPERVLFIK